MSARDARRDRVRSAGAARALAYIALGIGAATVFTKVLDVFLERLFQWNEVASAIIAGLLVGLVSWLVLYRKSDDLSRLVRSEAKELDVDDLTPRPYFVTGHSPIPPVVAANVRGLIPLIQPDGVAELCASKYYETFRAWQQSIRVMHFLHATIGGPDTPQADRRLRKVVVIDNGTSLADGTPQVALFIDLIRACFPALEVRVIPDGATRQKTDLRVDRVYSIAPDYETYEYVTSAFDQAFDLLEREEGGGREQIEAGTYIDVTPGVKVFSIAAAIQTLNRRAVFLYVTSAENRAKIEAGRAEYVIFGYDADAQFDLAGRG